MLSRQGNGRLSLRSSAWRSFWKDGSGLDEIGETFEGVKVAFLECEIRHARECCHQNEKTQPASLKAWKLH